MFGKGFSHRGNIEPFLNYKKLHRTGRLLKSLSVKSTSNAVILSSSAPYATEHEFGQHSSGVVIKSPYVQGGAAGVATGGKIHARPFMRPSKQVLKAPIKLIGEKLKQFGWRRN